MEKTTTERPRYWFPAKCYGWGWGLPSTGEGWATFVVFIAVCCSSAWLAGGSLPGTMAIALVAAFVLFAVAWWKGEPPRWRWGRDS